MLPQLPVKSLFSLESLPLELKAKIVSHCLSDGKRVKDTFFSLELTSKEFQAIVKRFFKQLSERTVLESISKNPEHKKQFLWKCYSKIDAHHPSLRFSKEEWSFFLIFFYKVKDKGFNSKKLFIHSRSFDIVCSVGAKIMRLRTSHKALENSSLTELYTLYAYSYRSLFSITFPSSLTEALGSKDNASYVNILLDLVKIHPSIFFGEVLEAFKNHLNFYKSDFSSILGQLQENHPDELWEHMLGKFLRIDDGQFLKEKEAYSEIFYQIRILAYINPEKFFSKVCQFFKEELKKIETHSESNQVLKQYKCLYLVFQSFKLLNYSWPAKNSLEKYTFFKNILSSFKAFLECDNYEHYNWAVQSLSHFKFSLNNVYWTSLVKVCFKVLFESENSKQLDIKTLLTLSSFVGKFEEGVGCKYMNFCFERLITYVAEEHVADLSLFRSVFSNLIGLIKDPKSENFSRVRAYLLEKICATEKGPLESFVLYKAPELLAIDPKAFSEDRLVFIFNSLKNHALRSKLETREDLIPFNALTSLALIMPKRFFAATWDCFKFNCNKFSTNETLYSTFLLYMGKLIYSLADKDKAYAAQNENIERAQFVFQELKNFFLSNPLSRQARKAAQMLLNLALRHPNEFLEEAFSFFEGQSNKVAMASLIVAFTDFFQKETVHEVLSYIDAQMQTHYYNQNTNLDVWINSFEKIGLTHEKYGKQAIKILYKNILVYDYHLFGEYFNSIRFGNILINLLKKYCYLEKFIEPYINGFYLFLLPKIESLKCSSYRLKIIKLFGRLVEIMPVECQSRAQALNFLEGQFEMEPDLKVKKGIKKQIEKLKKKHC